MEWITKMTNLGFTRSELETFTLTQLKRVCKYYDIEIFKSWNKEKLITAIMEYLPTVSIYPADVEGVIISPVPTKSARILNIERNRQKEE
jgi:hypothetical protein